MKPNKTERIKKKVIEAIQKGSTIKCACAYAGFNPTTLYEWIKKDKKFELDIERAQMKQVDIVVGELIRKATGYNFKEVTEEIVELKGKTKKGVFVHVPAKKTKTIIRHYPADVAAQVFYLCNRNKDEWKNVQKIVHSNDPENPIPIMCNGFMLNNYPKQKEEKKGKDE